MRDVLFSSFMLEGTFALFVVCRAEGKAAFSASAFCEQKPLQFSESEDDFSAPDAYLSPTYGQ